MTGLYARVTLNGKAPIYELMHDGEKLCDIAFGDLACFAVRLLSLLMAKQDSYTVEVAGREIDMTWHHLHSTVEQCTGALRFERLP